MMKMNRSLIPYVSKARYSMKIRQTVMKARRSLSPNSSKAGNRTTSRYP